MDTQHNPAGESEDRCRRTVLAKTKPTVTPTTATMRWGRSRSCGITLRLSFPLLLPKSAMADWGGVVGVGSGGVGLW